jgi:hypothetical protein
MVHGLYKGPLASYDPQGPDQLASYKVPYQVNTPPQNKELTQPPARASPDPAVPPIPCPYQVRSPQAKAPNYSSKTIAH